MADLNSTGVLPISAERLRAIVRYDPNTGVFTSLANRSACRYGKVLGHLCIGYIQFNVDGRKYFAHRLAWLYMTGAWPTGQIDHIDGCRANNQFANLRDIPGRCNQQNFKRARRDNKLGLLGVCKKGRRFRAELMVDGVRHHLGTYATAEEAHAAYIDCKRKMHEYGTI